MLDQSFLPILADQPPPRHFFAKGFQTIAVTDPILIRHCLLQWINLLAELYVRRDLLIKLVQRS